ncbi:MAG: ABC transporter ATP-binding protein [Victivallales bacterium]|nr:ABC transporter ATP-binding protein [Victivallales bacterium]
MKLRDFCFLFNQTDRLRFAFLVLLLLGCSLIEMLSLGAVPLFVAAVMGQQNALDFINRHIVGRLNWIVAWEGASIEKTVVFCGILLILLFILRTLYVMFCAWMQERLLGNRRIALSSRYFRAVLNSAFPLFRTYNSGKIMDSVLTECDHLVLGLLDPSLNFLKNSVIILTIVGLLVSYDPVVSLGAFFVLGLLASLFMLSSNKRMKVLGEQIFESRQEASKVIGEGIGIYRDAAITGNRDKFVVRLHRRLERLAATTRYFNTIQRSLWPVMELLTVFVLLGAMSFLLFRGRRIQEVAPVLSLLAVCLARMKGCMTELMLQFTNIRYHTPVLAELASHIRELEESGTLEQKANVRTVPMPLADRISVQGVAFAYPDAEENVLEGVSFEIPRGSSVAFVGATGSGKTTMAELLLGLFQPTAGHIYADGGDIFTNLGGWRSNIGFVPQEIYLFDDSIRANITMCFDRSEVDEDALQHAIRAASLQEFINTLPDKEDTVIGERGTRLSGGQRQRIGIARALYRNPSVLVFDEATSALDNETEAAVMSAIETLRGSHTLIIVAHRLTTVKGCNAIFRFKDKGVQRFSSLEQMNGTEA